MELEWLSRDNLSSPQFALVTDMTCFYNTPGKVSPVPPAEVLIIGCDRRPELPVMVKI